MIRQLRQAEGTHRPGHLPPSDHEDERIEESRDGNGLMDFILARIAEEEGFTLWDRTFNTLAPAAVFISTLRNYDFTTPIRTGKRP